MPIDIIDRDFIKSKEDQAVQENLFWLDNFAKGARAEQEVKIQEERKKKEDQDGFIMRNFRPYINLVMETGRGLMQESGAVAGNVEDYLNIGSNYWLKKHPGEWGKEQISPETTEQMKKEYPNLTVKNVSPNFADAFLGGFVPSAKKGLEDYANWFGSNIKNEDIIQKFLGQLMGRSVPGMTDFTLGVPYAAVMGAGQGIKKDGMPDLIGESIKTAVYRYGIGKCLHFVNTLFANRADIVDRFGFDPVMIGKRILSMMGIGAVQTKIAGQDILSPEGIENIATMGSYGALPGLTLKPGERTPPLFPWLHEIYGGNKKPLIQIQTDLSNDLANVEHNIQKQLPAPNLFWAQETGSMPKLLPEPIAKYTAETGPIPTLLGKPREMPLVDLYGMKVPDFEKATPQEAILYAQSLPAEMMAENGPLTIAKQKANNIYAEAIANGDAVAAKDAQHDVVHLYELQTYNQVSQDLPQGNYEAFFRNQQNRLGPGGKISQQSGGFGNSKLTPQESGRIDEAWDDLVAGSEGKGYILTEVTPKVGAADAKNKWLFTIQSDHIEGLRSVIDQIRSSESKKTIRIAKSPGEGGGTDTFVINPGLPDMLKNKGGSEKIIEAIQKAVKGEKLGIDQANMVQAALDQTNRELTGNVSYETLNVPFEIVQKVNASDRYIKLIQAIGNGWNISNEIYRALYDISRPKTDIPNPNLNDFKVMSLKTALENTDPGAGFELLMDEYAHSADLDSRGKSIENPNQAFARIFIKTQKPTIQSPDTFSVFEEPIKYDSHTGQPPDNFSGLASDFVGEEGIKLEWDNKLYVNIEKLTGIKAKNWQELKEKFGFLTLDLNEDVSYQKYKADREAGKNTEIYEVAIRKGADVKIDPNNETITVDPKDIWIIREGKNSLSIREKLRTELETETSEYFKNPPEAITAMPSKPDAGSGVKDIARMISRDFKSPGFVDFRGYKINNSLQLAVAGQILRDPRYEHLFIFHMKGNEVVGFEHLTSRMPGEATFFNANDPAGKAKFLNGIKDRQSRLGADSYYLMHNHPSGKPEPSIQDMATTNDMAQLIPGFKGHIIINSGQYGVINAEGQGPWKTVSKSVLSIPNLPDDWQDPLFSNPSLEHPELGRTVTDVETISLLGEQLLKTEDMGLLIHTNAKNEINLIQEAPINLIKNRKALVDYVRGQQRKSGTQNTFIYLNPEDADMIAPLSQSLKDGTVLDVITTRIKQIRTNKPEKFPKVLRVAETVTPYIPTPENLTKPLIEVDKDFEKYKKETIDNIEKTFGTEIPPEEELNKRIHINYIKVDSPEAISDLEKRIAENFDDLIQVQTRGKRTWKRTDSAAAALGMNAKMFIKANPGMAYNAERLRAAGWLLEDSSSKVMIMADKIRKGLANDVEKWEFLTAFNQHVAIQAHYRGAQAEAGRTLNILKQMRGTSQLNIDKTILDQMDVTGGREFAEELAKRLRGLETPEQSMAAIREIAKASKWDMIYEGWINGLLTNPATQVVNVTGSVAANFYMIPERFAAAVIGKISGTESGVQMTEPAAMVYGIIQGFKNGIKLAVKTLKTGEPSSNYTKFEQYNRRAITGRNLGLEGVEWNGIDIEKAADLLGETVRLPGRSLMAGDELTRAMAYEMELHAQAFREASNRGTSRANMDNVVADLLRNPTETMEGQARDFSNVMTWTNALGKYGQIANRVAQIPGVRYIIPFRRTPINLLKFIGQRTPLAIFAENTRNQIMAGGAQRDLAIAKMSLGSLIMFTAAQLVSSGFITGGGPVNKELKAQLRDIGWQPYSVKIGDQYVNYSRLDPFGGMIGLGADAAEILGQLEDDDATDLATAIVLSISKNVTSKTYLQGLSDLFNVFNDPERYGKNWIEKMTGSFIPFYSLSRAIERQVHPELNYVNGLMDNYKSIIPGFSKDLPPKTNLWGEPIVLDVGIYDIINPFYHSSMKYAPVSEELMRLQLPVSMPQKSISGVKLEPWEYYRYCILAGNEFKIDGLGLHDRLKQLINSVDYKHQSDGPEGGKAWIIRSLIQDYREGARAQLLQETPALRSVVEDAERKKLMNLMPKF